MQLQNDASKSSLGLFEIRENLCLAARGGGGGEQKLTSSSQKSNQLLQALKTIFPVAAMWVRWYGVRSRDSLTLTLESLTDFLAPASVNSKGQVQTSCLTFLLSPHSSLKVKKVYGFFLGLSSVFLATVTANNRDESGKQVILETAVTSLTANLSTFAVQWMKGGRQAVEPSHLAKYFQTSEQAFLWGENPTRREGV